MRDVGWRLGFTLTVLALLAFFGPSASSNTRNRLVEWLTGQTPQAQIAAYLAAISRGDRPAAQELWSPAGSLDASLESRRASATEELLAYSPSLVHRVLEVEWWTTCCEPGVTNDPDQAGAARVRVAIGGNGLPERVYVIELMVPGGYWGAAMGSPVRHWVIVDVYPEGATSLAWPWR